ncbi:hypothetical protein PoB_004346600 [Plakobranchus ocellatus]|uniref:PITH domain-containing protein n=1 Tax=Plakobranchus ocellatus TaxID=259542 RepID=A0AAV4B0P0_9GAST|nr:hypothetical protein PoB_004346600 [Plakobranchus ocellatus]
MVTGADSAIESVLEGRCNFQVENCNRFSTDGSSLDVSELQLILQLPDQRREQINANYNSIRLIFKRPGVTQACFVNVVCVCVLNRSETNFVNMNFFAQGEQIQSEEKRFAS